MLFKLAEMFYMKQRSKTSEHQTITKYTEERENYDFWKIRKDYGFWNMMDGLSCEKEVMSLYLHLGYEDHEDMAKEEFPNDRVLKFEDKFYYFSFYTKITEFKDSQEIDKLLLRSEENKCDFLNLYSTRGFGKKLREYVTGKPVNLFDINGIIKVVRTVKE